MQNITVKKFCIYLSGRQSSKELIPVCPISSLVPKNQTGTVPSFLADETSGYMNCMDFSDRFYLKTYSISQ